MRLQPNETKFSHSAQLLHWKQFSLVLISSSPSIVHTVCKECVNIIVYMFW